MDTASNSHHSNTMLQKTDLPNKRFTKSRVDISTLNTPITITPTTTVAASQSSFLPPARSDKNKSGENLSTAPHSKFIPASIGTVNSVNNSNESTLTGPEKFDLTSVNKLVTDTSHPQKDVLSPSFVTPTQLPTDPCSSLSSSLTNPGYNSYNLNSSSSDNQNGLLSGSKVTSSATVSTELICLRCSKLLREPLRTPCCGKNFCSQCLLPDIVPKKTCPFCLAFPLDVQRLKIPEDISEKLSSLSDVSQDQYLDSWESETMRILPGKSALKEQRSATNIQLPTTSVNPTTVMPINKLNEKQLFTEGVKMLAKSQNDYPTSKPEQDLSDHDCLSHLNSEKVKSLLFADPKRQHDCVDHVTKLIQGLQMRVTSLETELKTRYSKYSKREKSLLSKIATLQNEGQVQAVQYQEKINSLTSQLYFAQSSVQADQSTECITEEAEDERLEVILHRDENGSFGFNISGGHREDSLSCPIFVSKVSGQSIQGSPQHSPLAANLALTQLQINDQIVKVNEIVFDTVTHEEAVQIIKNSCDPVKFTIIRHVIPEKFVDSSDSAGNKESDAKHGTKCHPNATLANYKVHKSSTVACQTDPYLSFLSASEWCDGGLPPLPSFIDDPELWGSMTDIDTLASCDPSAYCLDDALSSKSNTCDADTDDVIASLLQINNYDFEYEEIVLQKSQPDEKLGITVCKGAPTTTFSQIFISKIEENSLAANDGRVSVGDQIVRINGKDISEASDIGKLFEVGSGTDNSNNLKITLLISRPLFTAKPNIFDLCEVEEQTLDEIAANQSEASGSSSVTEESRSEGFENIYEEPKTPTTIKKKISFDSNLNDLNRITRHENTLSTTGDKDSGLDCDSSTRNDSLSETGDHDRTRSFTGESGIYTSESIFSSEHNEYPFVSSGTAKKLTKSSLQNSQQVASIPAQLTVNVIEKPTTSQAEVISDEMTTDSFNISIDEASLPFTDEDENVYENVDHILPENEVEKMRSLSPPPLPRPNLLRREANQYQNLPLSKDKNRRSFMSEQSQLSPSFDERRAQIDFDFENVKGIREKSTLKLRKQNKAENRDCVTAERDYATIYSTAPPNTPKKIAAQNVLDDSRKPKEFATKSSRSFQEFSKRFSERSKVRRNDSMLSIPTHAKQYRSYLQLVKLHEQQDQQNLASEWKVKIRPDGSRYIAKVNSSNNSLNASAVNERKLNRAKILRDRTEKINKERASSCLTTDDEAASEMKVGRYWTREERTRQYLVSQEKKLRKQMMEHSRNQFLDDNLSSTLRRRKVMAEKAALGAADKNKILDTFITIQEIMTHGTNLHTNPLLSVTTV